MSQIENTIDYDKWKATMTNYQFNYLVELKDKYDALTHEVATLTGEAALLREENLKLKSELEQTRNANP